MEEQVRRGHEVSYFFSGRQYPYVSGPRLRRWGRGGVEMLEVVNSPLHDHGRQPELELAEPRIERMLGRAIRELRPDAVHVQELAGLPSSVLDVVRASGAPAIVTLQDYFPLCPTFKLLDADGRVCLRRQIGADCVATTAAEPSDPGLLFEGTLRYDLPRLPLLRYADPAAVDTIVAPLARLLARRAAAGRAQPPPGPDAAAAAFQRRRDVNVERLNRADRLIAMSSRVAEIYSLLGVEQSRLTTLELTLAHLESMRPRPAAVHEPITFATLGGLASVAKGARLVLESVRSLSDAVLAGRLRVLAFGLVDPRVADEAARLPGLELRGEYRPEELDRLLDEVDVGIMPSIWEEAYGYAGVEFLAKGIPVIANAIGGMPEYAREGETGWLNRSCSAEELRRIMAGVIEGPQQILRLGARLRERRSSIVKSMSQHGHELDDLYRELVAARVPSGAGS